LRGDYGYFDNNRLIDSLTVIEGINGGLDLAIDYGGIHALEALVLARYYMFTQVYYHKTRRIYDYYLRAFMESWKGKIHNFIDVIKYDDISLINDFRQSIYDNNSSYQNMHTEYVKEDITLLYIKHQSLQMELIEGKQKEFLSKWRRCIMMNMI
jgi:HD superfamily phosphohydrolase